MNEFKYSCLQHQELSKNGRHQLAQSHALAIYNTDSVYSFIPKNACSTLRYSLALANGCIKSEKDINWIHHNNSTFKVSLREAATARYTFVVLRCPYQRLASVFFDKLVSKDQPAWAYYNALGRQSSIDFLTFNDFVSSLQKPKILSSNIHWRPQVDFLLYENYHDYFCVENFHKAVTTLKEKINFDIHDARSLTHHGTETFERVSDKCYSHTPLHELSEMKVKGILPSTEALYDKESYNLVSNIYNEDFKLYREKFGQKNILVI